MPVTWVASAAASPLPSMALPSPSAATITSSTERSTERRASAHVRHRVATIASAPRNEVVTMDTPKRAATPITPTRIVSEVAARAGWGAVRGGRTGATT